MAASITTALAIYHAVRPGRDILLHLGDIDDTIFFLSSESSQSTSSPRIVGQDLIIDAAGEAVAINFPQNGVIRKHCRDTYAGEDWGRWAARILSTSVGGSPTVDNKKFIVLSYDGEGALSANRFEAGQRVAGFVQNTLDCRILLESQILNIKQAIDKFHLTELPRLPPDSAPPRLILTGSLIDTVPKSRHRRCHNNRYAGLPSPTQI